MRQLGRILGGAVGTFLVASFVIYVALGLADGQSALLNGYPWESVSAGVMIVVVVVLVNLIGERLASRAEDA